MLEVRFKEQGLVTIEVVDNGSGIAPADYDSVGLSLLRSLSALSDSRVYTTALKHHTSKLVSFNDLTTLLTFGFRGEALSSLCAVCEKVGIVTATATSAPVGTVLELARSGRVTSASGRAARQVRPRLSPWAGTMTDSYQRGTTITLHTLFSPLPVRRKELERHIKREFGRVLSLLQAYALVPCSIPGRPVRLSVANTDAKGCDFHYQNFKKAK
jgi:DNA mismatch repair protein PMS2